MSSKSMRKQRWARLNRIKKRRVNMFALSQKVDSLAAKEAQSWELMKLDVEQTYDLLTTLESKVKQQRVQITRLQIEVENLKRQQRLSWWQKWLRNWRKAKQFPVG